MKKRIKELSIQDKKIKFEFDKLASQANGSVVVSCGETVVLVAMVASRRKTDLDYFPLQVEYTERLYAGGRIKGSRWVKREGRPSDEAILSARLIDRCVRPLFPADFSNEVQIAITPL